MKPKHCNLFNLGTLAQSYIRSDANTESGRFHQSGALLLVESVTIYCEKCRAETKHKLAWERKKPLMGKRYRLATCTHCGHESKYFKRW
jgi:hypothetical protein